MDQDVQKYIDGIPAAQRPLFDRLHRLILEACPEAAVSISYGMPTYRFDGHRLHLSVWRHGVSLYGWGQSGDAGFTERHPGLASGRGTIRLRPGDAAAVPDEELRELARAALGG